MAKKLGGAKVNAKAVSADTANAASADVPEGNGTTTVGSNGDDSNVVVTDSLGTHSVAVTPGEEDVGTTTPDVVRDYDDLVRGDAERLFLETADKRVNLSWDDLTEPDHNYWLDKAQKLRDDAELGAGKKLYMHEFNADDTTWDGLNDDQRREWIEAAQNPEVPMPSAEPPVEADTPQVRETPALNNEAADGTNTSTDGSGDQAGNNGGTTSNGQAGDDAVSTDTVNVHKGDQYDDSVRELIKADAAAYGIDPSNWSTAYYKWLEAHPPTDMETWMAATTMWFNRAMNVMLWQENPRNDTSRIRNGEFDAQGNLGLGDDYNAPRGDFADDYAGSRRVALAPPSMPLAQAKVLATPSLTERREGTMHGSIDDLVVPY